MLPKLRDCIHHGATVYSDSFTVYTHIDEYFLMNSSVNHHIKEQTRDNAHTNNIESVCAVLKRTIGTTYTYVSPRLDHYLAKQVFRFNERENTDELRCAKANETRLREAVDVQGTYPKRLPLDHIAAAREKLQRAQTHVEDFQARVDAFLRDNLQRVWHDPDEPGLDKTQFIRQSLIPARIVCIVGDAQDFYIMRRCT